MQLKTKKLTDLLPLAMGKIEAQEILTISQSPTPTKESSKKIMAKLSEINEKPEPYMKHVKEFVMNPKGFFLISGNNGNGKTFTAEAIYNWFWNEQTDNMFWNQADLKMKWQSLYAKYGSVEYFFEQLINAPLLVLDDIGTTKPTEAFMEFLYAIVNKRDGSKAIQGTIITTNLNSNSMREVLGGAFVSRVASGRCIRHDGPDRRPLLF